MAGGEGSDKPVFGEDALMDRRIVDANPTKTDVDASGFQGLHLLQSGHFRQPQFQIKLLIAAQSPNQLG